MVQGTPTPVRVTAYKDRTFDFVKKTPPTSFLLKKCAGIEQGAGTAGLATVGMVSYKHVYEIALLKQQDPHLAGIGLEGLCKSIVGTARSMGIEVVESESAGKKRA
jgi:large subunit ribosomal protein L11